MTLIPGKSFASDFNVQKCKKLKPGIIHWVLFVCFLNCFVLLTISNVLCCSIKSPKPEDIQLTAIEKQHILGAETQIILGIFA